MAAAASRKAPAERAPTPPLLAELIATLPPSGATWPTAKREAWLKLAWQMFDLVYEGGGEVTELPAFLGHRGPNVTLPATGPASATVPLAKPATPLGPVEYIIDINGNLKRLPDGAPITFNDIPRDAVLWDERPERNRNDDIKCADGEWPFRALPQLSIANR
jgi:hypothetical protein